MRPRVDLLYRIKDLRERPEFVPLTAGFGGGLNTFAYLVLLYELGLRPDVILFADTGGKTKFGEKPTTYRHIVEVVEPWLDRAGFPSLTRVWRESPRAGHPSLYMESIKNETMPSRVFGMSSCAQKWKIEPQEKWLNSWDPARVCWSKIDPRKVWEVLATWSPTPAELAGAVPSLASELARTDSFDALDPYFRKMKGLRAKLVYKPFKILGYDGGETRRVKHFEDEKLRYVYPLYELDIDRDGCLDLLHRHGLEAPPKSACFFCPSSTKEEVIRLSIEEPVLFSAACGMEETALTSTKHELRNVKGLGRHWSWKQLVAMTEDEREDLPDAPVEACTICVDESSD